MTEFTLRHTAPGPVSAAFMASKAFISAIQGPIGSGKTSAALMKLIALAAEQRPSTKDGVRRFKACVVHQNYRQLWRSTIPSWWEWMPEDLGEWIGGKDGPATHKITFNRPAIGKIEFQIDYVAIGDKRAETVLRGYQPTVFLLNEADLLNEDVFTYVLGRAGRFPRIEEGGASFWGVLLDFNAPEADSWIESRIIMPQDEKTLETIAEAFEKSLASRADTEHITVKVAVDYFCQPGAEEAGAENIQNLQPGYYALQSIGQPDWYIERMIHNKTGYSRHGKVVWKDYNDRIHCADHELEPVKGIPLRLGVDAGGTPAAVIGQKMPNGQMRWLDEVISPDDEFTGPTTFSDILNDKLKDDFDGFKIASAGADPSAEFGGDEEDLAWLDTVRRETKIKWRPAQTNNLTPRFEAVRRPLKKLIDGHIPAFLISPKCRVLRKGLANGYRFRKREAGGTVTYAPEPDKNKWSHVCEALQYGMMVSSSYSEVMGRGSDQDGKTKQTHMITDDTDAGEIAGLERNVEDYL